MDKIELLVPAKNMECLKGAVENGADSVYLGTKEFNARTLNTDNNFTFEELKYAIEYCNNNRVKTNLTLNTLIKDNEFERVLQIADFAYNAGVSAIIVQDIGLGKELIDRYPKLDIHASTQNTITNIDCVKMLEQIGYKRAILSRELSMNEIEEICKKANIEIEVFIHGGLCISYSGQCLFSSIEYGLAGNRGMCVGSCRNEYIMKQDDAIIREGKILKPRDMCGLKYIPSLIKCGVKCLKIQGRTRGIDYIKEVTRIYRKYIDLAISGSKYEISKEDYETLNNVSGRGLTNAYFSNTSNSNFIVDTEETNKNYISNKNTSQLFEIKNNMIDTNNISISFEKFNDNNDYSLLSRKIQRVYIPIDIFKDNFAIIKKIENNFDIFIEMPLIILQKDEEKYKRKIKDILNSYNITGFVISNISDFSIIEEYKKNYIFIGNYTLNIFNINSCKNLKELGIDIITPSVELSNKEKNKLIENKNFKFEEIIYGNIPIMNMKYCVKGNETICTKNCHVNYSIIDSNNQKEYFCQSGNNQILTKIYGNKKIFLNQISNKSSLRIFVHNENVNEINNIVEDVSNGIYYTGDNYLNNVYVK